MHGTLSGLVVITQALAMSSVGESDAPLGVVTLFDPGRRPQGEETSAAPESSEEAEALRGRVGGALGAFTIDGVVDSDLDGDGAVERLYNVRATSGRASFPLERRSHSSPSTAAIADVSRFELLYLSADARREQGRRWPGPNRVPSKCRIVHGGSAFRARGPRGHGRILEQTRMERIGDDEVGVPPRSSLLVRPW